MKQKWYLRNVVEANRESPETFEIPDETTRMNQDVGALVKLHFLQDDPPAAERMWVEILERVAGDEGLRYWGRLRGEATSIQGLNKRDIIEFSPHNIATVQ